VGEAKGTQVNDREWAILAFEALNRGESVQVRPRGQSMRGRIDDGESVIMGVEAGRFEIGTTAGRSDGWVTASDVFGRVVAINE
jgi:hypothetical protein